ncbi:hypothetical protein VTO42DRAFT_4550 [Malbranchea cinnamomea]
MRSTSNLRHSDYSSSSSIMSRASDLRQSLKDANELKRYHDSRHKWAHGCRPLPGRSAILADHRCRPLRNHPNATPEMKTKHRPRQSSRPRPELEVDDDVLFDGPLSDGGETSPAGPEENPDVFYSFDAPRSPGHGEHILSVAIARALDRFESKETERAVREYEFIDQSEGSDHDELSHDEEGYEVVDYPKLSLL